MENERIALEKLKLQQEMEARRESERQEAARREQQDREQARQAAEERARQETENQARAAVEREQRENVSVEHLYTNATRLLKEHVKLKGRVTYKIYPRGNAVVRFADSQNKTLVTAQVESDDMTLPRDEEQGMIHLRGRVVSCNGGVVVLVGCKVLLFETAPGNY